eukprot:scaffold128434_cov34-Tisochrysis_lutea.AAC.2
MYNHEAVTLTAYSIVRLTSTDQRKNSCSSDSPTSQPSSTCGSINCCHQRAQRTKTADVRERPTREPREAMEDFAPPTESIRPNRMCSMKDVEGLEPNSVDAQRIGPRNNILLKPDQARHAAPDQALGPHL